MFIPFPPESDATASGPQGEGCFFTLGLLTRAERDQWRPAPQPKSPHRPTPRRAEPQPSALPGPRPQSFTKAESPRGHARLTPTRPAPPCRPGLRPSAPPPERVRAHPRAGRSARPARGAPLAPRTYLRRPRPARAARSPTTIGRPSRPTATANQKGHPGSPRSAGPACRAGERRAGLGGARPIPGRGRLALGKPRSGLQKLPIGGAGRSRPLRVAQ